MSQSREPKTQPFFLTYRGEPVILLTSSNDRDVLIFGKAGSVGEITMYAMAPVGAKVWVSEADPARYAVARRCHAVVTASTQVGTDTGGRRYRYRTEFKLLTDPHQA